VSDGGVCLRCRRSKAFGESSQARLRVQRCAILFVLASVWVSPGLRAQTAPDASYQVERRRAAELFQEGKRLEALPLLEQLVKANPKDAEMLVDLAAALADHAALVDREAAGRERLRARDLLEQAHKLGDTNPLALNLLEILAHLPENGDIKFCICLPGHSAGA
jgi:hypothetical protein